MFLDKVKNPPMKSLTWNQVNGWRLSQHFLAPRLGNSDLVKAAARTGGIQAQVLSAAELALWARIEGLTDGQVNAALWKDRTLIKTWVMRGTLHLLPASDLPLYVAARSLDGTGGWERAFTRHGFSKAQFEAFVAAMPEILGAKPITKTQIASAIRKHTGSSALGDLVVASSWGGPLKIAAFRGELSFGPNQGQHVTFVNPRRWLDHWEEMDPHEAFKSVARRYLEAYGPATHQDFSRWWWGGPGVTAGKKLFQAMKSEFEEVDVEGWRAVALRSTVEAMASQPQQGPDTVRLLPLFDAYTLGLGRDIKPLLAEQHRKHIFRPQGWISAVVLVNGYMKGVWEHKTKSSETNLKVRLFAAPTKAVRKGIEGEAERLGRLFQTPIKLTIEQMDA